MTLEERVERLERKACIKNSDRPKLRTIFWMRGFVDDWSLWKASIEGITSIETKIYHPWPTFDLHVSDEAWQWSLLEKPE